MSKRHFTRRHFLKLALATTLLPIAGGVYATEIEPAWLELTQTDIFIPNLPPAFVGFRIAHISDLHYDGGHYMPLGRLQKVVNLVNALDADLIVHTGDFVSEPRTLAYLATRARGETPADWGHSANAEKVFAPCLGLVKEMKAKHGAVAVLGNHDHWVDAKVARAHLRRAGILLVENSHLVITQEGAHLTIAGVDDLWTGEQDLERAFRGAPAPAQAPRILLCHNPDYAVDAAVARHNVQVMLSGHTHGGQVYVPGLGAPILPIRHHEFARGLVQTAWGQVYVSRGIGMITPPVRFLTRPEIALLRLTNQAAGG